MLEDASPLADPIHLMFALFIPGYHLDVSPIAKSVPLISWILLVAPIFLFLTSWLTRKTSSSQQETDVENQEKIKTEVLKMLVDGLDTKEIGNRLGISGVQASLLKSELFEEYKVTSQGELLERVRNSAKP